MIRNRTALLLGALALASVGAASATSASAATVEVRTTPVGEVLTDANGFTLFVFSLDHKKTDMCQSIEGCIGVWPPLVAEGPPTAGPGVNPAKLGTITLADGTQQVTYKNHPLYGYVGDVGPEETFYVGAFAFRGYWFGLNGHGHKVGRRQRVG
jgi:predicted lipoprotein with Yx(FWY)xxD motif